MAATIKPNALLLSAGYVLGIFLMELWEGCVKLR